MPKIIHTRTLHEAVRTLLREDPRSVLEIHKESGLPFYWLRKMKAGAIPDPGVNRTQALYEFLTNTQLTLK